MTTLALIPARAGSKGLPGKNLRELQGQPLIAHSVRHALDAGVDRVVVSTEDGAIADAARLAGAEVPFVRPAPLASDEASSLDVILHAADTLSLGPECVLVLLQPTSPLRTGADIRACVDLHERSGRSVVSVTEHGKPLAWLYELGAEGALTPAFPELGEVARRQDARAMYYPNGAVYVWTVERIRAERTSLPADTLGYVMPAERSVDIDTLMDWRLVEALLRTDEE